MKNSDWTRIFRYSAFRNLDGKDIDRLLDEDEGPRVLELSRGDLVFEKGDPSDEVYVLGSGTVEVFLPTGGGQRLALNELRKGAIFGEIALFEHQPRSASVVATQDALVLEIPKNLLLQILSNHPDSKVELALLSTERLRHVGESVLSVAQNDVDAKIKGFEDKLDAELKTTNAQLAAARTIFDQTSQRASEIINSAERARKLTIQASAIGAAIIAVAAFFGIREYQDIIAPLREAERQAQQAQVLLQDARALLRKTEQDFAVLYASTEYITSAFWLPRFEEAVLTDENEAFRAFSVVLSSGKADVTQTLLQKVLTGLIDGQGAATESELRSRRQVYQRLLTKIVNEGVANTPLVDCWSHALLLSSFVLLDQDRYAQTGAQAGYRQQYDELIDRYRGDIQGAGRDFLALIEVYEPADDAQSASPTRLDSEQFASLKAIWQGMPN